MDKTWTVEARTERDDQERDKDHPREKPQWDKETGGSGNTGGTDPDRSERVTDWDEPLERRGVDPTTDW